MDKIAEFGNRWSGWAKIVGSVVSILIFLGVGSFIYNEVWQKKSLTYTILPSYDLGEQAFSGLVIENRGRVPLTDVRIILTDLEAPIQALKMPGAHEPANIVDGGEGQNQLSIQLPRLSKGGSLSIYLMTSSAVKVVPGTNFLVVSGETAGESSAEPDKMFAVVEIMTAFITLLATGAISMKFFRDEARSKKPPAQSADQESSDAPPSP